GFRRDVHLVRRENCRGQGDHAEQKEFLPKAGPREEPQIKLHFKTPKDVIASSAARPIRRTVGDRTPATETRLDGTRLRRTHAPQPAAAVDAAAARDARGAGD